MSEWIHDMSGTTGEYILFDRDALLITCVALVTPAIHLFVSLPGERTKLKLMHPAE